MVNFWQGKKVLVTGHTGFKGSWLSLWLHQLGAEVTGFALPAPTTPNLFMLARVAEGMTSVIGDVRDVAQVQQIFQAHQPDIVIHLAAQPLVRYSYREPVETYATNVMGTIHVLEAARQTPSVKAVVNVTTDKCYENKEWHWSYRENDRLGGRDPYSNSKACAEQVTDAYRLSYFQALNKGLATARAGNVMGGGDWAEDRLIPDIIRAAMRSEKVQIRHPDALRPWQYVLEPLNGYLLLAERLYQSPQVYADSWNFGPRDGDMKPVSWIADYITRQWQGSAGWCIDERQQWHEATCIRLDCAKSQSCLSWRPCLTLTEALQQTLSWYRAFQANEDMRAFTLQQISHFSQFIRPPITDTFCALE